MLIQLKDHETKLIQLNHRGLVAIHLQLCVSVLMRLRREVLHYSPNIGLDVYLSFIPIFYECPFVWKSPGVSLVRRELGSSL
jgi:hypothetical protein